MEPFVRVMREAYGGLRHNKAADPDMTFRGHLWAMCGSSAIALNYSQLFILPIHGGLGAAYITTALVSMLISSSGLEGALYRLHIVHRALQR